MRSIGGFVLLVTLFGSCWCLARNSTSSALSGVLEDPKTRCTGLNERFYPHPTLPSKCSTSCESIGATCAVKFDNNVHEGCECKAGFYRMKGVCVSIQECLRMRCPNKNEIYKFCPYADHCEKTCPGSSTGTSTCAVRGTSCPEGCQCDHGFVRDPTSGQCLKPDQCPKPKIKCDVHEEPTTCYNPCNEDCPGSTRVCPAKCFNSQEFQCQCKKGFVRWNGICINQGYCGVDTKRCFGKGEQWLPKGVHKACDPVCGQLNKPCNIQHIQASSGCQCPQGMAQVPGTRDCIPVKDCGNAAKHCPKNMKWNAKANYCTDHCNAAATTCAVQKWEARCVCDTAAGWFMDDAGQCVRKAKCPKPSVTVKPKPRCDPNTQKWTDCGTLCMNNCDPKLVCTQQCTPMCVCDAARGYYQSKDRGCVQKSQCFIRG